MILETFIYILSGSVYISGVYTSTIKDKLKADLFMNYDSDLRPYCNNNEPVKVILDVALRQMIDMYEPLQIIHVNIWIRMKWSDCRLTWNASEYEGINTIIVPYALVWVPDLTLYDNTGETFFGKQDFKPSVHSDGTIIYNFPSVVDNRCIIDIAKFPYDSQVCKFVFGSWAYHGEEIDFIPKNENGDLSNLEENVEWDISSMPVERHVLYYNCCPEPFVDITFYVIMKRKPRFYIINILIPYFMITAVSVFGFVLPCESGEKVGLAITVMLSLAVFQSLVADSLPPSSDHIPLLAIYFDFSMLLVGFATIIAVIVNNLHYRDNQEIPKIVKVLFLDYGCKITFVHNPCNDDVSDKSKVLSKIPTFCDGKDYRNYKNKNKMNKKEKQFSKVKLCCGWLRSMLIEAKQPETITKVKESMQKQTSDTSKSKVDSQIKCKQTNHLYKTAIGSYIHLPPKTFEMRTDNIDRADDTEWVHEVKNNTCRRHAKINKTSIKTKLYNETIPSADDIEEILKLTNYRKKTQQDGQNITSINIRPRRLSSIKSNTSGLYTKQNMYKYGKQYIHSETEGHLNKIERTLEHIDSKISRSAEWKALAVVVDRLSCYCFIVVGSIGMIVIFILLH